MRVPAPALVMLGALGLAACGKNNENAGAEQAKREAEAAQKAKPKSEAAPAQKLATPVPGEQHVPCSQLIDLPAFQTALGEKDPPQVKDVTKNDARAAASCAIVRGGKRPSEAEQKAMLKRQPRLGVLPGDDLCIVTAYCWTIEDADRFKAKCKQQKDQDDDSLGSYACVHVFPTGADDVKQFTFFDEDTRCILQARGGPSNVNNETIQACAKTARDTIGPTQIASGAAPGTAAGTVPAGTGAPVNPAASTPAGN
ncbi:MAG TPA: hypothetical protein VGC42_14460 [Kofleriaceae bacterium]